LKYLIDYERNNILFNKVYNPFIKAYFRYIDDNFILFRGTNRQAKIMVNSKINKHIQCTFETQLNNKIHFLDLTVSLNNNKFEFNVYTKPTQTDSIIPYDSH